MMRAKRLLVLAVLGCAVAGCDEQATSDLNVERLPPVTPSLPNVPTLPPPPHPITYPDGSYSVFGVRHRMRNTMDTDVSVTGYIVKIYEPPECEEGDQECPRPAAPHIWIGDTPGESDEGKLMLVAGYAENQDQIDEAVEQARRGRYEPPDPESGMLPIPTDFAVGNKVKIQGRFTRMSGMGFNSSEGLLDYKGHETLSAGS